jgi:sugar phosphate isomerase/epimerase
MKAGTASIACASTLLQPGNLFAKTLKLPLGLQLYSVRQFLPTDFAATLKSIGELGYREVEAAGYFKHSVAEVKQAMNDANLKLVSAHYSYNDLHSQFDQVVDFNHQLGVSYIICSYPGFKDPSRQSTLPPAERGRFTLEDWRWNADQFNAFGEKIAAAGMKFGYHNHVMEFRETDGVVPFHELMRLTDPAKVTMEMDCGWVVVGGGNPVELLKKYPKRISMLHVKDFKTSSAPDANKDEPKVTELGQGSIDYAPIFREAGNTGNITHCFVEQEAFDVPWKESLKIDAGYMHKLGAA